MALSPSEKKRIQTQFDVYCKKVLINKLRDVQRQERKILSYETFYDDLSNSDSNQLYYKEDKYERLENLDWIASIQNGQLLEIIRDLSEQKQTILYQYYWQGLNDLRIGEELGLCQQRVSG